MHDRLISFDGAGIGVTRIGAGRPLLLIHGFISSAQKNWIEYGTAAMLAESGFDCIMPDLRGHGRSDVTVDYPPDALRRDMIAVLDHFGITDFDCAGYSLGARTAARLALTGHKPKRLILSGMGLDGLTNSHARRDWFIDAIQHRDAPRTAGESRVAMFMRTMAMDADAAIKVLMSQVETAMAELAQLTMKTLVLAGRDDDDNGSAPALAQALPDAAYEPLPGNHMSAITSPAFGRAILAFLQQDD